MNYYPAFLDLKGRKAVVVGGGKVAERKVLTLLQAGADVKVISPKLTDRLLGKKNAGRIRHINRRYRSGDLKDSFLVIAATDSPEINSRIAKDAPLLVNVVDVPSECNFIVPSVMDRGNLILAISTGGTSPAFAKALRKELQKSYGPVFSEYLEFVKSIRMRALIEIGDRNKREKFLRGLASEGLIRRLRTKNLESIKQSIINDLTRLTG